MSARRRKALSFYGLWFGAYPYETLTVVDPPDDGLGSGGMEYPTFITGYAPKILLLPPFLRFRLVEDVTIHEFGHQYWYGMVGSNEFEDSWLDEGINTDSEFRTMQLAYGPRDASIPGGIGFDLDALAHSSMPRWPTSTRSGESPGAISPATRTERTLTSRSVSFSPS